MRYSPNNKLELIQLLNQNQAKIKSFGVNRLDLFGSFQTDSTTIDSDIDFIVEFKKEKKTYDNFIELAFFLEELSGRKVELITPQSLSKYIGPHILKQAENVIQ